MSAAEALLLLLSARSGTVQLPAGRIEVSRELLLPEGAHDLTVLGNGTTLHLTSAFKGRAAIVCRNCRNLSIRNLAIDGNRQALETPMPFPPAELLFSKFFSRNGILIEDSDSILIEHVDLSNIPNFAVLISRSKNPSIIHVSVADSGSRNAKGRNNTSGGILLEEGTSDFLIADSVFRRIRGNAVWTHSYSHSPRNVRGKIAHNQFTDIGRDAIQIGHASEVTVTGNTGQRIGMRVAEVDLENMGTPVGIDTAGNVDRSVYEYNRFEEVNGKCIDLDGFHDGVIRGNTCINRGKPEDYAYGNFGISLNNTSTEMHSRNIVIEDNTLAGMKFGGIFVIGAGHKILRNKMRRLNTAHCNESRDEFSCLAIVGEPGFLESGIYLARGAEKPDPARNLTIENNSISGWKMAKDCIRAAPGVSLTDNKIQGNRCTNE